MEVELEHSGLIKAIAEQILMKDFISDILLQPSKCQNEVKLGIFGNLLDFSEIYFVKSNQFTEKYKLSGTTLVRLLPIYCNRRTNVVLLDGNPTKMKICWTKIQQIPKKIVDFGPRNFFFGNTLSHQLPIYRS
jgi:hypothetical protein